MTTDGVVTSSVSKQTRVRSSLSVRGETVSTILGRMLGVNFVEEGGRDGYADFYKKDITFNVLGPVGDKVEEWTLKGAYVQSTAKGSLDWSTDSALMLSITIAYDYAILQF